MKHEDFTPIGQIATTPKPASPPEDGKRHGKAGAVASPPAIANWLAGHSPAEMDKAAVLRASQHGVALRVRFEGRYPEAGPSYTVAVGCDVSQDGNHAAAAADLEKFLTPAPMREIEGWLAELSVITARRKGDDFAEALALTAYASRLAGYPADVARKAVVGTSWQFWPTWAELEKVCEAMTGPRRQMLAACKRGPVPVEPERRPPTADERARINALIAEMFPAVPQAWRDRAEAEMAKGTMPKEPTE